MRRFAQIAALLLCSAHLYAQASAAAPIATDIPVFKVNVSLVTVDAAVVSKKTGRAIGPLAPSDFLVYENGVPQPLAQFTRDELPLSVVLLFDLTDSVRPVLDSLAKGALASLQHLKPEDEVSVMVYAASAKLVQDFTTDRALAAAAITKASRMKSDEAAFFNEGLYQAAQQTTRAGNPNARRVIIWLTDNVPNFPSDEIRHRYGRSLAKQDLHTEKQALEALFKSGAMVCALLRHSMLSDDSVMSRTSHWADYMIQRALYPPGDVNTYAQQTGGEVSESTARHMPQKLADMIDSIRSRYTLGFKPDSPANGTFREVRVKVSPEVERSAGRVIVVAKKGYYR